MMGPKVSETPPEERGWLGVTGSEEGLGKGVEGTLSSGGIIWQVGDTHTQMGVPWTEHGAHILPALADVGSLLGLGC